MTQPDVIRCHDCGRENPAGATECVECGYPLSDAHTAAPAAPRRAPEPKASAGPGRPPTVPHDPSIPRPRPRPPRANPANQASMQLWLVFGAIAAAIVVYVAVKANYDRVTAPVAGASSAQQALADSLLHVLGHDSTNVAARVKLGDVLFDTGNWTEAVVHYKAALARDSSLTHALVDLGVCYYNLSDPQQAEQCFELALVRDPNQPIALFNMGIVFERRQDYRKALSYFHRALQAHPPEMMAQPLVEAIKRAQTALGSAAPPIGQ